ncbi:hypothetical protein [Panacagrimonas sp.]|uniref:hypothetical protein n=1 Tax=Panacagrimonas sp. TaxID=2480088 RepID=UPI003B524174
MKIRFGIASAVLGAVLIWASTTAIAQAQLPTGNPLTVGCDWILAFDPATPGLGNTAFPELNARYWIAAVSDRVPAGTRLRVQGRFPQARYSALHVHDGNLFLLDALSDNELVPDAGSANLFLDRTVQDMGVEPGGRYTATVRINTPIPAQREDNTLYRPRSPLFDPPARKRTALVYRTYLPVGGNEGGFELPHLVLERPGKPDIALADTPDTAACAAIEQSVYRDGSPLPISLIQPLIPSRNAPAFVRFQGTALNALRLGVGYNPHNAFMYVKTDRSYGDYLLIRGRLPSYTTQSQDVTVPEVRYYSVCQYGAASGKVYDCLADRQLVLDDRQQYTVAIGTDAARPAFLDPAQYGWLPWGPEKIGAAMIRELLDHPTYAKSIQKSGGSSDIDRGDLTPAVTYCPRAVLRGAIESGLDAAATFDRCQAAGGGSLLSLPGLPLSLPGLLN